MIAWLEDKKKIQIELCLFWVQAIPCWKIKRFKGHLTTCPWLLPDHEAQVPSAHVICSGCAMPWTAHWTGNSARQRTHVAKEQLQILKSTILVDYILIEFRQIENICKMSLWSSKNVKYKSPVAASYTCSTQNQNKYLKDLMSKTHFG